MIPGIRGGLISGAFARDVLPSMPESIQLPPAAAAALTAWSLRLENVLGITSSVRAITDVAVLPLLDLLGISVHRRGDATDTCLLHAAAGSERLVVLVSGWGEPLDRVWRSSVVHAIADDARWCLCCNGRAARLVDAQRTWSREYLEFDCLVLGSEPTVQQLLWTLLRAESMRGWVT